MTEEIKTATHHPADTNGDGYDDEEESGDDKTQGYRISGGILVLHGKEQTDLELTTDEKIAFQETMDEFVTNVSDMVDFNKLNVYSNNVEWSGKLIEFDLGYESLPMFASIVFKIKIVLFNNKSSGAPVVNTPWLSTQKTSAY